MPRKGAPAGVRKCRRAEQVSSALESRAKCARSVYIGVSNGRRWLTLRERLGLKTDEDLAVYLLDLADSIMRYDGKCSEANTWNQDCDKENDIKLRKSDSPLVSADDTLRRSPRKQNICVTPDLTVPREETVESFQTKVLENVVKLNAKHGSRSKYHKSKTKHCKEKRRKKRQRDDEAGVLTEEADFKDKAPFNVGFDIWKNNEEFNGSVDIVNSESPVSNDAIRSTEAPSTATEVIRHVASSKIVSSKTEEERKPGNVECFEKSIEEFSLFHDLTTSTAINGTEDVGNLEKEDALRTLKPPVEISAEKNSFGEKDDKTNLSLPSEALKENVKNLKDGRKLKKQRKRLKHEVKGEDGELKMEEVNGKGEHKHRKKKHKHGSENKNKNCRDVRKAPQDGIIVFQEMKEADTTEKPAMDFTDIELPKSNNDNSLSEPQRLAIKIKFCQDCNSRHVQDACPLTTPQYKIEDSITLDDWLHKHKDKVEVIKVANSDDPMSEGYGRSQDDVSESEDDTNATERHKAKNEREEHMLEPDVERPIYARESIPEYFELKLSSSKHGLGVYVKQPVPMYANLGPLVGKPVREMDIPDDFSMRHIWEINDNGNTSYISTTNPLNSNWIRYVRPSHRKEDRTSTVITKQGALYLMTTLNLTVGMELTYWADSQCSAWNRKNKMDKTNCGGCNLNFHHPIYYRLHCWIFHDTNYSLTIRKYHCKVCGAVVLGKDNIVKHAAELHAGRGAYQCQYCKKFFLRLNYLEMHRTYGCSQNPQRSRPLCDFCGRKFCQPQKLKVHIKRMHSDMSEVLREFQCKSCLKLLGSRAALQRHMKEVHHKDVVGAATCNRCGKMFQNKSNLKIHMLTHSGVKPFKCKESGCKAAFTTKQCLQFHYKKVHGLSEEMMPKIERSVAYTFDAYSGGLVEDTGRGKSPRFSQRNSQDNSYSMLSDDCSSESFPVDKKTSQSVVEFSNNSNITELGIDHDPPTPTLQSVVPMTSNQESASDVLQEEVELFSSSRIQSKGSKKWLGEFNPPSNPELEVASTQVYEYKDDSKDLSDKVLTPSQVLIDESKLSLSVYRRQESTSASLLVEAALDAAERDIGAVTNLIHEESDTENHLYSISNQIQSPIPARSPQAHLDSYIQQDELMSSAPTSDNRHTPPSHLHVDYHIHRPTDYISTSRTHSIEHYLHDEDIQRVSSPNGYIHVQQDDLGSPSATPNPRYHDLHHHHHQVPTDNLSSDEGDSVAQNLCLSVKEKTLQLDLSTSFKYETLESGFARERGNFETLVLNSSELQGLDMSARSYHHNLSTQVPNRYHHHQHIYEMSERQSVDLSRTGGYLISSPPPPPASPVPPPPSPYQHGEMLRVVSLDLTPGGRHTVDLSLSRSHHLHSPGSRILVSPPLSASSATSHIVPEGIEGRILSPPPSNLPGYNPAYPVNPAPYHPPRPGYHHYSSYY